MTEQKQRRKPRKYTDEFNWWNYIVPANADVISAVNMTLLLPCLTSG